MVVVPLSKAARKASETRASTADSRRWVRMAAAGTLVASGVLLLARKRRWKTSQCRARGCAGC